MNLDHDLELYKDMIHTLNLQIVQLYAEKEYLEKTIGTSDPVIIAQMIKNMEQQLIELYKEKEQYIVVEGNKIIIQGPRKVIIKKKE